MTHKPTNSILNDQIFPAIQLGKTANYLTDISTLRHDSDKTLVLRMSLSN